MSLQTASKIDLLITSAHEFIVEHIEDAKEVDKRLENGIHQLLVK